MVSSINSVNTVKNVAYNNSDDVKTLVRYVNSQAINESSDTFTSSLKGAAISAAVFEGIPLLNYLKRSSFFNKAANKTIEHSTKNTFVVKEAIKSLNEFNKKAFQTLLHGEGKFGKRLLSYIDSSRESVEAYKKVRSAFAGQYKEAKGILKGAKNLSDITKATGTKIKAAQDAVSKVTAKTATEAGTKAAGKFGKFTKFFKSSGAGAMLVFSGISEMALEVLPTFKELGQEKGMKQLGKSAVKVVGDAAGFIGGEYLGAAIGTAICPGIGTAVGAVCGFVGGILGSFVMGKITTAITGKSEREIAKEEQINQQSQEISNNTASIEELKEAAKSKIAQEAQTGTLSEDSKVVMEILNNMENPFDTCVA